MRGRFWRAASQAITNETLITSTLSPRLRDSLIYSASALQAVRRHASSNQKPAGREQKRKPSSSDFSGGDLHLVQKIAIFQYSIGSEPFRQRCKRKGFPYQAPGSSCQIGASNTQNGMKKFLPAVNLLLLPGTQPTAAQQVFLKLCWTREEGGPTTHREERKFFEQKKRKKNPQACIKPTEATHPNELWNTLQQLCCAKHINSFPLKM